MAPDRGAGRFTLAAPDRGSATVRVVPGSARSRRPDGGSARSTRVAPNRGSTRSVRAEPCSAGAAERDPAPPVRDSPKSLRAPPSRGPRGSAAAERAGSSSDPARGEIGPGRADAQGRVAGPVRSSRRGPARQVGPGRAEPRGSAGRPHRSGRRTRPGAPNRLGRPRRTRAPNAAAHRAARARPGASAAGAIRHGSRRSGKPAGSACRRAETGASDQVDPGRAVPRLVHAAVPDAGVLGGARCVRVAGRWVRKRRGCLTGPARVTSHPALPNPARPRKRNDTASTARRANRVA